MLFVYYDVPFINCTLSKEFIYGGSNICIRYVAAIFLAYSNSTFNLMCTKFRLATLKEY